MNNITGSISKPLNGRDGKDGVDGKSAYEIACIYGYEGTEEEWLKSLGWIDDNSIGLEKLKLYGVQMPFLKPVIVGTYVYKGAVMTDNGDGSYTVSMVNPTASHGGGFELKVVPYFDKLYIDFDFKVAEGSTFTTGGTYARIVGGALVNLKAYTTYENEHISIRIPAEVFEGHDISNGVRVFLADSEAFTWTVSNVRIAYNDYDTDNFYTDYDNLRRNVKNISEAVSTPYKNKKILYMGDSITYRNVQDVGWCRYFNEILEPSLTVNTAVSSARWCDYEDTVYDGNPRAGSNSGNTMGNQVEKLLRGKDEANANYSKVADYDDFDIIMIAMGTNDTVPTEEIEKSFTVNKEAVSLDAVDKTTFAGAFRYAVETLQRLYPNAQIFICTPIQANDLVRPYVQTKAKRDYLIELAERMSVNVVDTFSCGICGLYEVKNAEGRYLIDGLHPTPAGAEKIGKFNAKAVIEKYVG